jgi:hypothetical protein
MNIIKQGLLISLYVLCVGICLFCLRWWMLILMRGLRRAVRHAYLNGLRCLVNSLRNSFWVSLYERIYQLSNCLMWGLIDLIYRFFCFGCFISLNIHLNELLRSIAGITQDLLAITIIVSFLEEVIKSRGVVISSRLHLGETNSRFKVVNF